MLGRTTVPVNVGLARFAFKSRADCVAVDTGLFKSEVLSTSPKPTSPLRIPVGLEIAGDCNVLFVRVSTPVKETRSASDTAELNSAKVPEIVLSVKSIVFPVNVCASDVPTIVPDGTDFPNT